jgi:thiol-disulfide isomerase/thioredoxin
MSRRPAAVVAGVLALIALGGCASTADDQPSPRSSAVAVDSPALRAQKAQAGIEPCPPSSGTPTAARGLPAVTLPCLGGGRAVDLAGLTGRPLVLNFWAPYCGSCRTEMPALARVHADLGSAVSVIGVDYQDTEPGGAIAFAGALRATYPQLADVDGLTKAPLQIQGLPYTFFVRPSGTVAYVQKGPLGSVRDIKAMIATYLGVHAAAGGSS